jgi:hypothetical protein
MVNYIVTIQGWIGKKETECETEAEVWAAIGEASFGALYEVEPLNGLSNAQFIPF